MTSNPIPYTPVKFEYPFPKIRAQGTLAAIGSCFAQDNAQQDQPPHCLKSDASFSCSKVFNGSHASQVKYELF